MRKLTLTCEIRSTPAARRQGRQVVRRVDPVLQDGTRRRVTRPPPEYAEYIRYIPSFLSWLRVIVFSQKTPESTYPSWSTTGPKRTVSEFTSTRRKVHLDFLNQIKFFCSKDERSSSNQSSSHPSCFRIQGAKWHCMRGNGPAHGRGEGSAGGFPVFHRFSKTRPSCLWRASLVGSQARSRSPRPRRRPRRWAVSPRQDVVVTKPSAECQAVWVGQASATLSKPRRFHMPPPSTQPTLSFANHNRRLCPYPYPAWVSVPYYQQT